MGLLGKCWMLVKAPRMCSLIGLPAQLLHKSIVNSDVMCSSRKADWCNTV